MKHKYKCMKCKGSFRCKSKDEDCMSWNDSFCPSCFDKVSNDYTPSQIDVYTRRKDPSKEGTREGFTSFSA